MDIVSIEELKLGDVILIEGMEDNEVLIVTVGELTEDDLIIPVELGGMDYTPPDHKKIVRLCSKEEDTVINILSDGISYR